MRNRATIRCDRRRGTDKFPPRAENRRANPRPIAKPSRQRAAERAVRPPPCRRISPGRRPAVAATGEFDFGGRSAFQLFHQAKRFVQRHAAFEHQRQGRGNLRQAGFLESRQPPAQGAPHLRGGHGHKEHHGHESQQQRRATTGRSRCAEFWASKFEYSAQIRCEETCST